MHSYGIAYTDGTEKIVQLNRSVENNLMSQMEHRMEQKGKDEVWRLPEYKRKPSSFLRNSRVFRGADGRIRTGDLILTKDALYRLSYISIGNEMYYTRSRRTMQALSVKNLSFRQKSLFASVYFVSYTAVTLAFTEMLPERIPVPESSACARAALPNMLIVYSL